VAAVVLDDTAVYVSGHLSGSQYKWAIVKLNQQTLAEEERYELQSSENAAFSMTSDDNHLYVGLYTFPGIVLKLGKADMSVLGSVELKRGENGKFYAI
jgi:hypothetical protein